MQEHVSEVLKYVSKYLVLNSRLYSVLFWSIQNIAFTGHRMNDTEDLEKENVDEITYFFLGLNVLSRETTVSYMLIAIKFNWGKLHMECMFTL
jgi:hypothetical protein